jgi:hypothetical protein
MYRVCGNCVQCSLPVSHQIPADKKGHSITFREGKIPASRTISKRFPSEAALTIAQVKANR